LGQRVDEIFALDLPTDDERKDIAKIHLEKRGRKAKDFDLGKISKATDKFTGAEIEECVRAALFAAFSDDAREIKTADIVQAAKETVPLVKTMKEQVEAIRDFGSERARPASIPTKDKGEEFRRIVGDLD